jgi:hypothetical protein
MTVHIVYLKFVSAIATFTYQSNIVASIHKSKINPNGNAKQIYHSESISQKQIHSLRINRKRLII